MVVKTANGAWRIGPELRIFYSRLFNWRSCLLSNLVLLFGISYLFVPIDLIPDRIPVVGHLDELSFLLFGFVGSRKLVPASLVERFYGDLAAVPVASPQFAQWQNLLFAIRVLRADLANFFLLQYRDVDGFLVTGKNSGTHWLKFMLSCALAEQFSVPPPVSSSGREADRIISHPKWPARYRGVPRIGSSHTIPSVAFAWPWLVKALPHPPVVVLVRDIGYAMRSNYVKWHLRYRATPTDYVRGDPVGRRYVADVWWYVHFFNRWGDVASAQPDNVLVVRYEDLRTAPAKYLRRIAAHYGICLSDPAIAAALRYVDRQSVRVLLDPTEAEIIVPSKDLQRSVTFAPDDEEFLRRVVRRHLRRDFGYGQASLRDL